MEEPKTEELNAPPSLSAKEIANAEIVEEKLSGPRIEVFPVLRADVVPYARKRCGMCFGKGEFNTITGRGPLTESKLCGCALRRFLTARPFGVDVVQMKDKSLAWRPGREPQHWRDEVQALAQARTAEASTLQPATVPEKAEVQP